MSESSTWWEEKLAGKKVFIQTFGCAFNQGDSDLLASVLESRDSHLVSSPSEADVVIINTCIVIEKTERKMLKVITSYNDREVFVTGCLPLALPKLIHNLPEVGIIYPESVHRVAKGRDKRRGGPVQVVQIGPGCRGSCRYCITRLARGSIRSIPPDEVIADITEAERTGAAEIRLAGQDLSSYGYDTGTSSLADLLRLVPPFHDTCRVRLGMMNPATLLPIARDVARAMKNGPFFRFLHLPVQSGSDRILGLMNRGYRVADVCSILEIFRSEMPDITIATDIITGFPGETGEDHEETKRLLAMMKPGMVNVTRYSYRPGTGMGREDELPDRIRKDRSREVITAAYAMLLASKKEKMGMDLPVIVTEQIKRGSSMARSPTYEGVVILEDIEPGTACTVNITGCTPHYLTGSIVRD